MTASQLEIDNGPESVRDGGDEDETSEDAKTGEETSSTGVQPEQLLSVGSVTGSARDAGLRNESIEPESSIDDQKIAGMDIAGADEVLPDSSSFISSYEKFVRDEPRELANTAVANCIEEMDIEQNTVLQPDGTTSTSELYAEPPVESLSIDFASKTSREECAGDETNERLNTTESSIVEEELQTKSASIALAAEPAYCPDNSTDSSSASENATPIVFEVFRDGRPVSVDVASLDSERRDAILKAVEEACGSIRGVKRSRIIIKQSRRSRIMAPTGDSEIDGSMQMREGGVSKRRSLNSPSVFSSIFSFFFPPNKLS